MKFIMIFCFVIVSTAAFSQAKTLKGKIAGVQIQSPKAKEEAVDTIPTIYDQRSQKDTRLPPKYYINGTPVHSSVLGTLDPKQIDSIHIEKNENSNKDLRYDGKIFVKLKEDYQPNFINLLEFKDKYVDSSSDSYLFFVNHKLVTESLDKYMVDEKYVLSIFIDEVETGSAQMTTVVQILTRSEKNVADSKKIMIRGDSL